MLRTGTQDIGGGRESTGLAAVSRCNEVKTSHGDYRGTRQGAKRFQALLAEKPVRGDQHVLQCRRRRLGPTAANSQSGSKTTLSHPPGHDGTLRRLDELRATYCKF